MQGPEERGPGTVTSSSGRLLSATAATDWQTYLAPCHAPARSHARWHQQPGRDQQGASCGGASRGATSAGAASSTAADRRCQAPALSPPSASALCSAKTCGADTGSAHAVMRGLRGLRTRACHGAAELGGLNTGSLHVASCQAGEPRAGAIGRRRQACQPFGTGALVTASLSRAGGRHTLDACNAYAPQRPFPAGAPRRRASLRGAGPGSLATQARRAGPEAPAARPAS